MGTPTDLVRDVIAGNLKGARDEIEKLDGQIAELQEKRAAHEADRVEYERLLETHEGVTSNV